MSTIYKYKSRQIIRHDTQTILGHAILNYPKPQNINPKPADLITLNLFLSKYIDNWKWS